MADGNPGDSPQQPQQPPPLSAGPPSAVPPASWTRIYVLVCVLAVLVMALLWWFSAHYNLRLPKS